MNSQQPQRTDRKPTDWKSERMRKHIRNRYAKERRFRTVGFSAIMIALAALVLLLGSIIYMGYSGFLQTQIKLNVTFDAETLGLPENASQEQILAALPTADFGGLVRKAIKEEFPDVTDRPQIRRLTGLVSQGARTQIQLMLAADPSLLGKRQAIWVPAFTDVDMFVKGVLSEKVDEADRPLKDQEIAWIKQLKAKGDLRTAFNSHFFNSGDSREPELAGIAGAAMGSLFTIGVTLILSFPIGIAAAIYLEEFAAKNRWTDLIEVNINNLAAVPSIVFGLLGLAVFLGTFGLPRSAPLVGGLTLALLTLPTIIIAARAALKAVPPSIRDAARGLGASPLQVVAHHVLPLALPGILTGTIIGMARALGESAPLLMIGMVAFVVDIPHHVTDAATALPVQVYLWADSAQRGFVEKTSAGIMVLLAFLLAMNALAIWLRQKYETRW